MYKDIFEQEIKDWNKNAQFFANENLMPFQKIIRKEIYDFYDFRENEMILEAGGGVIKIKDNMILVDFSPKMINRAKELNPEKADKCILASAHQLPFSDNTFDVIVANGLMHHLKVQGILEQSIKEFYRVLKPNGKICIFDRAFNLVPVFFFYLRKPLKLIYKPKSQCSTSNEPHFLEKDLKEILKHSFKIEKRKFIVNVFFQILIIFTNVIQYIFRPQLAQKIQGKLYKTAEFIEKKLSYKILCAEQCVILRKI